MVPAADRAARGAEDPEDHTDDQQDADDEPPMEQEVDRILEKISRSGEASLTSAERDKLARASRRLKDRRG